MSRNQSRRGFSDEAPVLALPAATAWIAPWLALGSVALLGGVAHRLGATWLAEQTLGIPAVAWLAILAGSLVSLRVHPHPVPLRARYWRAMRCAGRSIGTLVRNVTRTSRATAHGLAPLVARVVERVNAPLGERFAAWIDERSDESRVRVLDLSGLECRTPGISRSRGSEWQTWGVRESFDAVIEQHGEAITVSTPVRAGRDAAWFDWGRRCPLAYSSVFPARIDPETVTLSDGVRAASKFPRVLAALVDAAAVSARHVGRLDLSDRLRSRTPVSFEAADAYFLRLAEVTVEHGVGLGFGATMRAAARVSSAWLLRAPIDEGVRLRLLDGVARIAADEPEVMLRLAAARFASFEDSAGMDALMRADRMLRLEPTLPGADPALFIQSELGHGAISTTTLGRVAAGICLLCAGAPAEKLAFIRDDLLDDLRYAGLLVGADQERALLAEVFRALEKARRAERYALPASRAA